MSSRRRAAAIVLALALACTAAACSTGSTSSEPTSTTFAGAPPPLPAATLDAVTRLVALYGSGPVASTTYAYGTRHQARRVLGMGDLPKGQVDSDVFVVTVDGAFALAGAGGPKDTFVPKGRYLVAMFTKANPGTPIELGLTDLAPHLAQVGQVADGGSSS